MKRKWYAIPAVLLLICLLAAVWVRTTYVDTSAQIGQFTFGCAENFDKDWEQLKVKDSSEVPQKLIQGADIIVEAKFDGERIVTDLAFYSTVQVTHVYKGAKDLQGTPLRIVEQVLFNPKDKYLNYGENFLFLLQKGERYLLFLSKMPFQPQKKLHAFEKNQYIFYTSSALSAFRLSHDKQTKVFTQEESSHFKLDNCRDYDLPATSEKTLKTYYQVKEQVLQQLQNG